MTNHLRMTMWFRFWETPSELEINCSNLQKVKKINIKKCTYRLDSEINNHSII